MGGEKLLDVSYMGICSGGGFLMETKQGIWRRNRRFGNDTGGSDREQHFVTHDRRAYLESGDVSNRLQSPNIGKVKRKTNVYLLFLCVGALTGLISPPHCSYQFPGPIGDLTMLFTIPLLRLVRGWQMF